MMVYPSPSRITEIARELRRRLAEDGPSRIQILSGPRQVGKTTLLLKLAESVPGATYWALDAPEASLPGWWDGVWREASSGAGGAVVLLDEIQYLPDWQRRLKAKWDEARRRKLPVRVVASGSSSLLLGRGYRESLAGRFEVLRLLHWEASDLAAAFGLAPDEAVLTVVERGGYPGGVPLLADERRWRAYIKDAILEPAIGRDVLALEEVRRPALLRQLAMICMAHPAQIVSLQKLQGLLQDPGALETLAHYLELLERAYLVAAVQKYSAGLVRRRSAPPKIVVLNNALVAAMSEDRPDAAKRGAWVENACLAFAWNRGWRVFYWREEPYEVDAICEAPEGRWAFEVKTGPWSPRDVSGLLEFARRFPAFRPVVLCSPEHAGVEVPGVRVLPWTEFLKGNFEFRISDFGFEKQR